MSLLCSQALIAFPLQTFDVVVVDLTRGKQAEVVVTPHRRLSLQFLDHLDTLWRGHDSGVGPSVDEIRLGDFFRQWSPSFPNAKDNQDLQRDYDTVEAIVFQVYHVCCN